MLTLLCSVVQKTDNECESNYWNPNNIRCLQTFVRDFVSVMSGVNVTHNKLQCYFLHLRTDLLLQLKY